MNAAAFSTRHGANLTDAREGFTYIFTIPPDQGCSGTVVAIQYCYHADLTNSDARNPQNVFEFLSMTRSELLLFTVTSRFTVQSTPQGSNCVTGSTISSSGGSKPRHCCDTHTVIQPNGNQFQIPSSDTSSFIFGIRILANAKPLAFRPEIMDFHVEQFQTAATGNSFSLRNPVSDTLLLLRLLIGIAWSP